MVGAPKANGFPEFVLQNVTSSLFCFRTEIFGAAKFLGNQFSDFYPSVN